VFTDIAGLVVRLEKEQLGISRTQEISEHKKLDRAGSKQ
jgi:hypothetical protein